MDTEQNSVENAAGAHPGTETSMEAMEGVQQTPASTGAEAGQARAQGDQGDRVRRHTSGQILQEIDEALEASVRFYSTQPIHVIDARIAELDQEWSIERWLEVNASALALSGTVLGVSVDRRWFLLPVVVLGFLFQHATIGWCPPLPVLRRLGVRTRSEIDREKFALKALRGDFRDLPKIEQVSEPSVNAVLGAVLR